MTRTIAFASLLALVSLPSLAGGAGGCIVGVPEPASLALLAAGAAGLLIAKRRRRK